jgi:hypothetical protein
MEISREEMLMKLAAARTALPASSLAELGRELPFARPFKRSSCADRRCTRHCGSQAVSTTIKLRQPCR